MDKKIRNQLSVLPQAVSRKAIKLIKLVTKNNWYQFGNKITRNSLISIPVSLNIRLLYQQTSSGIKLLGIFKHSDYEKRIMK